MRQSLGEQLAAVAPALCYSIAAEKDALETQVIALALSRC